MTLLLSMLLTINILMLCFCLARTAVLSGRSKRVEAAERRFVRLLARSMDNRPEDNLRPLVDAGLSSAEKIVVGELLCWMRDNVAEYDGYYFRDIVGERCRQFYIRRTRLSIGFRRARYLRILTALPVEPADRIRNGCLGNGYCNFYKMLIDINSYPLQAMKLIESYRSPMSPKGIQKVCKYIANNSLPVRWNDFFSSDNANLKMIGLSIIASYQIESGVEYVYKALSDSNKSVRDTAMQTLVRLKCRVSDVRVDRYVESLGSRGRRRFYRFLIREGYSKKVMQTYIDYEVGCGSGLDGYIASMLSSRNLSLRT